MSGFLKGWKRFSSEGLLSILPACTSSWCTSWTWAWRGRQTSRPCRTGTKPGWCPCGVGSAGWLRAVAPPTPWARARAPRTSGRTSDSRWPVSPAKKSAVSRSVWFLFLATCVELLFYCKSGVSAVIKPQDTSNMLAGQAFNRQWNVCIS